MEETSALAKVELFNKKDVKKATEETSVPAMFELKVIIFPDCPRLPLSNLMVFANQTAMVIIHEPKFIMIDASPDNFD